MFNRTGPSDKWRWQAKETEEGRRDPAECGLQWKRRNKHPEEGSVARTIKQSCKTLTLSHKAHQSPGFCGMEDLDGRKTDGTGVLNGSVGTAMIQMTNEQGD